jgi:hypothetical protein
MKAAHPHTDCRGVSEVIGPLAPQIVPKSLKKVHINQLLRMSDLRALTASNDEGTDQMPHYAPKDNLPPRSCRWFS